MILPYLNKLKEFDNETFDYKKKIIDNIVKKVVLYNDKMRMYVLFI